LLYRFSVLHYFGFQYTDSDQTILWQGLQDYSQGIFHEPRFYGQAYNSMLESFFAIPLFKMGVPAHIALPIITTCLALFPFLMLACFFYNKKHYFASFTILSIPLLMPLEYDLISSLPRGFVTGIFISSLGIYFYLKKIKFHLFFFGLFIFMGFSLNANSVLLSIPFTLYIWWQQKHKVEFYYKSTLGLGLAVLIHFWIANFYVLRPAQNIHQYWLHYSFSDLWNGISYLDEYINFVSPLIWKNSFLLLFILVIYGLYFLKKNERARALYCFSIPVVLILTLGINKVHDGSDSIFFHKSRMYLALPVLIAFGLSFVKNLNVPYKTLLLIIPILVGGYKTYLLPTVVLSQTNLDKNHIVDIAEIHKLKSQCEKLQKYALKHDVSLLLISDYYGANLINYGCESCVSQFPETLNPATERRTWRLIEEKFKVNKNVLLMDLKNSYPNAQELEKGIFLLKNNSFTTEELMKNLTINFRKF
ncbi:MAG: hypothetical protein ABF242_10375, partial [Flavobacteriales bacterium]